MCCNINHCVLLRNSHPAALGSPVPGDTGHDHAELPQKHVSRCLEITSCPCSDSPKGYLSFFAPTSMAPKTTYERLSEAEEQPAAPGLIKNKRRRHWFCVAGLVCLGVWVAAAQGIRALNRPYLEAQQNLRPAATNGSTSQLPVVLWHGMGDSCCADWSIGAVANHLRSTNPGKACSSGIFLFDT